ncbi:hypothetical protein FQA47_000942 [Oryzias melastigma]|uniref:Uncharacterized protein n=1 Tax=Oryzias melastigma TaxID=30732 RepID=A0A834BY02_ORYME|nr:hypothetical protein FQA47_000942 [Oryzias melastigma]
MEVSFSIVLKEQQQRRAGALKASCNLIDHRAESKAAHDDGCVRLPRSAVVLLCRALEDMEEEVTVDFLTVAALCLIGTRSASMLLEAHVRVKGSKERL